MRTLVFACNGCHGEYGCQGKGTLGCEDDNRLNTAWIRERGRAAFGEPARHAPSPCPSLSRCASRCARSRGPAWHVCQRRTWRGARRVGALQPALRPSARGRAAPAAAASLSPRAHALPPPLAPSPCRQARAHLLWPPTGPALLRCRHARSFFQVADEAARAEIRAAAAALVAPDRWWAGRARTAVHIVRTDTRFPGRRLDDDAPLRAAFAAAGVAHWETCCNWTSPDAAREGIEKIARADVVVGMHGAGLSHCLWMREGAVLVEAHSAGEASARSPSLFSLSLFFLARSLARSLTLTYCWRAYARARPLYLVLPQYTPPPPSDSGWRVLEQTLLQKVVR